MTGWTAVALGYAICGLVWACYLYVALRGGERD
jgi:hypothetical protein